MGKDLYESAYLKSTFDFFKRIKEQTYEAFTKIDEGIILEVGCGTGQDACQLARLVDSNCVIVGVDHDASLFEETQQQTHDIANLHFLQSDAATLPYKDNEVSGIRNERLIQHLENPKAVYQEFYRVLKPGGTIVFVETDWSSLCLYAGDKTIKKAFIDFMFKKRIPNGEAVMELAPLLSQMEFKDIRLQLFPLVSYDYEMANTLIQIEKALLEMRELDMICEAERLIFLKDLKQSSQSGSFAGSLNFVMLIAQK